MWLWAVLVDTAITTRSETMGLTEFFSPLRSLHLTGSINLNLDYIIDTSTKFTSRFVHGLPVPALPFAIVLQPTAAA